MLKVPMRVNEMKKTIHSALLSAYVLIISASAAVVKTSDESMAAPEVVEKQMVWANSECKHQNCQQFVAVKETNVNTVAVCS